jgi:hypothetical protein
MDKSHRFTMLENQVLEPRNLEVLERVKGSSKPNPRTNFFQEQRPKTQDKSPWAENHKAVT